MDKILTKEERQRYLDLVESFTLAELERWLEIKRDTFEDVGTRNYVEYSHMTEVLERLDAPDSFFRILLPLIVDQDHIVRLIQARRSDRIDEVLSGGQPTT